MDKEIPAEYQRYLGSRTRSLLDEEEGQRQLRLRGFWVGGVLSFFLAAGAPYGNMIIRGSYMALDFSTPGAIFLFLLLIGALNTLFKISGRSVGRAALFAAAAGVAWILLYWPFALLDLHSPGFFLSSFLFFSALANVPLVGVGRSLVLNRSELILVYVMLLIVSALCTMGLGEQILPLITALFYFASPENKWAAKLFPHLPAHHILVDDGTGNRLFYEGLGPGQTLPYGAWIEPLLWWGIFLLALYVTMVSVAVIVRRQWMERERLPYPIAQVGLAMVRGERERHLVNDFFKQPAMWIGLALPLFFGSLLALHSYDPAIPVVNLTWHLPFVGRQSLRLTLSFAMLGFSYFINANIAAGIWFFHLFSKLEKQFFILAGISSQQKITYGVSDFPFLGYQGVGALVAMVLVSLWLGREHLKNVALKALGCAPWIDDTDEILSYRSALFGALGGGGLMVGWLGLMGTPAWVALLFVLLALLIFIGVTRIVAEAGLAAVRAPMIAPDLLVQGLGSGLVGPTGTVNLSLSYMWAADIRVFVMATCTNALKMIEEMDRPSRRLVFWAIILALLIGSLGSFWLIFSMAYQYGGINLNNWFFKGAPETAYNNALRNIEAAGVYWPGWGFFFGGAAAMAAMMWARQRLLWWPVHPLGFPIGANSMLDYVWFSVFAAWLVKRLILRYGGAALYRRSQSFFLGLIAGQVLCNGLWLVVDYFTGKVGNSIFWV